MKLINITHTHIELASVFLLNCAIGLFKKNSLRNEIDYLRETIKKKYRSLLLLQFNTDIEHEERIQQMTTILSQMKIPAEQLISQLTEQGLLEINKVLNEDSEASQKKFKIVELYKRNKERASLV